MNLINTCRNISLHSEEILFNWQQEILYRFAIDWRCPFLDAIASPSTYPCQSVSEWVSQWVIVSDLEIAIAYPSFASLFFLFDVFPQFLVMCCMPSKAYQQINFVPRSLSFLDAIAFPSTYPSGSVSD